VPQKKISKSSTKAGKSKSPAAKSKTSIKSKSKVAKSKSPAAKSKTSTKSKSKVAKSKSPAAKSKTSTKSKSKVAKSKSPAAKSKTSTKSKSMAAKISYAPTKFSIPKYRVGPLTSGINDLLVKFSVKNKGSNTAALVVMTAGIPKGNTFWKFHNESKSSCVNDATKLTVTCAVKELPVGKLALWSWRLKGAMQNISLYTATVIAVNARSQKVTAVVI